MHKAMKVMAEAILTGSRKRTRARNAVHYKGQEEASVGEAARHLWRHVVMRVALAGVFVWFGVQQLFSPWEWTEFVPSFVSVGLGIGEAALVRLHGFLLLTSAVGLLSGFYLSAASILGIALLAQIIFGLAVEDGDGHVIARDLGLLGLAIALALDPTRARWSGLGALPKVRKL